MFTTTTKTQPIQPASRSEHIGIAISRSGFVTLDQYFQIDSSNPVDPPATTHPFEMCKFLMVTGQGSVVYQYSDTKYGYLPVLIPGIFYPVLAIRVVTSHAFTAGNFSTTATGINWYGGI